MKTYFAELFSSYDGENFDEKARNYELGVKAENFPESLTRKEVFIVSSIIERMQFSNFSDVVKLENLRINIIKKL